MSIALCAVCRPSTSGDVIVVASYEVDIPQPSTAIDVAIPTDYMISKIIQKRVRLHFDNEGEIKIEGFYIHYATLIGTCTTVPSLSQGTLLNDKKLSPLFSTAQDHALQQQIQPTLEQLVMAENAQRPTQDARISDMRRQVEEVKNVMASNVASIMERGERLDSIERRTDELQASSANFKMTAHRVQRKMCMMNAKWTVISVIGGIIVAAIVILLILDACGVFK
ncbi:hypothetical protein RB195_000636 [Necator americanus]|uniref:V-SNARE coiled-coil homology domain-containing protein n=1 Tax=Necator americanus TaxID=51031 RepID=A0ABR1DAN6_NECAM